MVRIFLQVCEGLADAHAHALVHRDVKPANLFLHEVAGGEIVVKVCDFGIAKIAESEAPGRGSNGLTQTWQCLGSPAYMSPEQMRDPREVDARSDVWSVCVSMYEALSGARPWPGAMSPVDIGVAIATRGVPPLRDVAPWLNPGLERVVHHGLALDKASRFESVSALAEALRPFARDDDRLTSSMLHAVPAEQRLAARPSPPPAAPVGTARRAPWWRQRSAGVVAAVISTSAVVGYTVRRPPVREPAPALTPLPIMTTTTMTPEPAPSARTLPKVAQAVPPATSSASAGTAQMKAKRAPSSTTPTASTRDAGKAYDPLDDP